MKELGSSYTILKIIFVKIWIKLINIKNSFRRFVIVYSKAIIIIIIIPIIKISNCVPFSTIMKMIKMPIIDQPSKFPLAFNDDTWVIYDLKVRLKF